MFATVSCNLSQPVMIAFPIKQLHQDMKQHAALTADA